MDYSKDSNDIKKQDAIVDIDLSAIRKKKFRINIDDNPERENNILELNTSDLSIIDRIDKLYGKLEQYEKKSKEMTADLEAAEHDDTVSDDDAIKMLADNINEIDKDMREVLDDIFDAPVSSVCAPSGTMFDPINGKVRYEYIFDKISNLYEQNLAVEMKKMAKATAKHTNKYTKKKYVPKKK